MIPANSWANSGLAEPGWAGMTRKCVRNAQLAGVVILLGAAIGARAATPAPLLISSTSAPAGGWAQIAIYAVSPMAISSGHLVLSLDATAFGNNAAVGLFGANGDAVGAATVNWPQIDIQFSSASGGIGQLPDLPVIVVSVPVLAAAAGRTVAVTATSPDSSVTVAGGSVTVQGSLSVQNIPAGLGVAPAGTVVPVYGTGFTASTTVTIDGVEIASSEFVSAQEIDVTLGGAAELVGKRARVTQGGVEFDYFCFAPNAPLNFPENTTFGSVVATVQPLFPMVEATALTSPGQDGAVMEVQNPNSSAATVSVALTTNFSQFAGEQTLTIPAGSWAIFDGASSTSFQMTSNLPVRAVVMSFCGNAPSAELPVCPSAASPADFSSLTAPVLSPASLAFAWQAGSQSSTITEQIWFSGATRTVTASVTEGSSWLAVNQPELLGPSPFEVSVNASQLAPGTYQGAIQVSEIFGPSATLPVSLTVSGTAAPAIAATPATLSFSTPSYSATPYTQTIQVTSSGGSVPFSIGAPQGVGVTPWVQVSPMSGTTPATLSVTWNPATVTGPNFQLAYSSSFTIYGPASTVSVPVSLNITGVQTSQNFAGETGQGPNGLVFSAQTGSGPQTQTISVLPVATVTATSDQAWLSVAPGPQTATVVATVTPAGLAPGVYNGNVTVSQAGLAPATVPVTLGVWSTPPALSITPTSMTFVTTLGSVGVAEQFAQLTSGGVPVLPTVLVGGSWLFVTDMNQQLTPVALAATVNSQGATGLGQYLGSFTVEANGSSVYVPVTYWIEPAASTQPVVSQVVNAASGIQGAVSPGEIVSIRGNVVGSVATSSLQLSSAGSVATTLNGLQVTFDGQPAPLIYTSVNQTNLIVPYSVAGKTSTVMQVTYAGAAGTLQTEAWTLPVTPSIPAIFTVSMTGAGQGAIVNGDGTVNSGSNPAARGSLVSIYATGEGQTVPAGVTGSVTQSDSTPPVLPVVVTIGGVQATVEYAGEAPAEVAGLLQVNAIVPPSVTPGSQVPVTITVGGVVSQSGVTIAVN